MDIGRIDLLSGYSLFDIRKGDAHRVVSALKGADFFGKRLYCEIAVADKDYASENKGKAVKKRDRHAAADDDFAPRKKSRRERREERFGGKKETKGRGRKKDKKSEKPEFHGNYDKFKKRKD